MMESLHLNRNIPLQRLLKKRESHLPKAGSLRAYAWGAESYGLDRAQAYLEADQATQERILAKLTQARLEEAYHIEKAGIAFGAKMILSSETFEERKLYAHFTAEESEHLAMIESYLPFVSDAHLTNSFLLYLSEIIKTAPKNVLVFIIQVILEGWGIEHYTELANTCLDPKMQASLKKIVQDEAGHHGSGMLLFSEEKLSAEEREHTLKAFELFLSMVKAGPYALVALLKEELNLNQEQIHSTLEELNALEETQRKLKTLRGLATRSGAREITQWADRAGLTTVTRDELLYVYQGFAS